ncbi:flagellar motor protein MotB [Edaphobacter dinghuensis]|uniref:Flagellar motor protein MotD n=1 Tax=Edaphobacter dinghuensis TaxID=1560005 RepID=A0A917HKG9_9BACT|nr:flagellar motor protein MotB [Edaphobacter dinghuensis]GGG81865.1 flagellar motor protein MotD [Edaphobacter dinghuensis]
MSRKKKHEHVNHERWLVSYADFITLLFAFFVVLFASSQSNKAKQTELSEAMQSAFTPMGVFEAHSKTPPLTDRHAAPVNTTPAALPLPLPSVRIETAEETEKHLNKLLAEQIAAGHIPPGSVTMRITTDGLVISLHEAGFFPSGSAEVRAASIPMLSSLAMTLPQGPLRIEGHTDNVPIHNSQFPTNWELSTARATAIARLLLERGPIDPANLSAAGYAEFHPVASNSTAEGRAQNRRVDIILLRHPATSR